MLADSSLLLYSPLPNPFASPPSPPTPPPTLIPPISSSACFLRLSPSPLSPASLLILLSAFPRGPDVALRAWALRDSRFVPEPLSLGNRGGGSEIVLGIKHGFKVRMCGSVNVFVVYSPTAARLWVMGGRVAAGGAGVEVMKCTVVECAVPVYSTGIFGGVMVLGEIGGVRVFPLRPLVRGKREGRRDAKKLPNGMVTRSVGVGEGFGRGLPASSVAPKLKGEVSEAERVGVNPTDGRGIFDKEQMQHKHRTLKIKQISGDHGSFFLEFTHSGRRELESKGGSAPLKAVAIHALSQMKFLILDSFGDLHIVSMRTAEVGIHIASLDATIKHVDCSLKVMKLAVLPDSSSESQIAWISDGSHSLHVAVVTGMKASGDQGVDERKETSVQFTVTDAIFTAERIHDIVPLASNAALTLAQGNFYAYAIA